MRIKVFVKSIQLCSIALIILLVSSCFPKDKFPVNYNFGTFPDSVVNLEQVNTEYDDYNSSGPPMINYQMALVFSTNRYTKGEKYDLVDYNLFLQFNQYDGTFGLNVSQHVFPFFHLTDLANSADNEFGPLTHQITPEGFLTCFASDRTGNMEIFVSYWTEGTFTGVTPIDPTPFRIQGVNSPEYDAYPTFIANHSEMYLCSNRDDNLDIYKIEIPKPDNILSWIKLADTTFTATPVDVLNSPVEDACPYINGRLMVFTSKREGGYGGYDLYYSLLGDDGWSEPVNFGPDINTEYNEFRPIVMYAQLFENDLMIFSSDRPGGKGGFDLYYTGIDRMTIVN
ncbi:MAG: PD40 domain-containing protein [Bacteroidales bacterium]|nr:PD40 domain-containing protein [Bacteroidales bacterium]